MTGRVEVGTGKGLRVLEEVQRKFHIVRPKNLMLCRIWDSANSTWVCLDDAGKERSQSSFAYMQTRPSKLSRCHLCSEHSAQWPGPAFICLLSLGRKRETGLPEVPTRLTGHRIIPTPLGWRSKKVKPPESKIGQLSASLPLTPTLGRS